jgi:hypothetical protein
VIVRHKQSTLGVIALIFFDNRYKPTIRHTECASAHPYMYVQLYIYTHHTSPGTFHSPKSCFVANGRIELQLTSKTPYMTRKHFMHHNYPHRRDTTVHVYHLHGVASAC